MPIQPFGSGKAIISKSPRQGNNERFSTGNTTEEILVWEVWNSRYKKQVSPYSKIINDETTCVVRTHDARAAELESDDSLTFEGYTYSVQGVHSVKSAFGLMATDFEVTLK